MGATKALILTGLQRLGWILFPQSSLIAYCLLALWVLCKSKLMVVFFASSDHEAFPDEVFLHSHD